MKTLLALCGLLAAGCVNVGSLTEALDEPVKAAQKSVDLVSETERGILRARAMGALTTVGEVEEWICDQTSGVTSVSASLSVFVDGLEAIKKVGEKPSDTSYAGYISMMKKYDEIIATDPKAEKDEIREKREAAIQRCSKLAIADAQKGKLSTPVAIQAQDAFLPGLDSVMALNGFIKSVLAAAADAKRNEAVKATISKVAPQMREAVTELKKEDARSSPAFGPSIEYASGAGVASVMNKTRLGATLTMHRWFAMQRAKVAYADLAGCRGSAHCATNASAWKRADEFADAVVNYRSLARIDSDKILIALDGAAASAENAMKMGTANFLDSLVALGTALSDMSDARDKYMKTR